MKLSRLLQIGFVALLAACGGPTATPAVKSVTVSPATAELAIGGTQQLSANVAVENGASTAVTWSSSDATKASVSPSGLVTAVAAGTATITATSNADTSKKGQATITVKTGNGVPAVKSVTVSPATAELAMGGTQQFSAAVVVENGASTAVTWSSSDTTKATVSAGGLVTAIAAGTATITATSNADASKKGQATITVNTSTITEVKVNPATANLNVGQELTLLATVTGTGNFNQAVTWSSSDPSKASVDATGKVKGLTAGSVNITATAVADQSKSATAAITVKAIPATISDVGVDPELATLDVGGELTLLAKVIGSGPFNPNVTWSSSDTTKASVDATGKVKAITAGEVKITATSVGDPSKSASAALTIEGGSFSISDVAVEPSEASLKVGESLTLKANVGGTGSFDPSVSWKSSEPTIATVDSGGAVKGIQTGVVEIIATALADPSKSGSAKITVEPTSPIITGVSIDPPSAQLQVGETVALKATVTGFGNFDPNVTWYSADDSIATVDANGVVTGVKAGIVTIKAASVGDPTKIGGASIGVKADSVITKVTISPTSALLSVGATKTFIATVSGSGAYNPNVTWSSSDPSKVKVDSNGEVSALAPAINVLITATSVGDVTKSASVPVTVASVLTLAPYKSVVATVNQPITSQLPSVVGGVAPYTYSAITALPAGIVLNPGTGAISGTPTAASLATDYTIKVTDFNNATAQNTFNLTVNPAPTFSYSLAKQLTLGVSVAGNFSSSQSGGTAPFSYAITSGNLPNGLGLGASGITGTPSQTGSFPVTIQLTDANGAKASSSLTIVVNAVPSITYTKLKDLTLTKAISAANVSRSQTGGSGPLLYSATGLPTGITINAFTGNLSGTPTVIGTFNTTVTAKDANNKTVTSSFSIKVNKAPTLSYGSLINVDEFTPNGMTVALPTLSGGTGAFSYSVSAVSGPTFSLNFSLNATTGVITAKLPPLAVGTYVNNITVTDTNGATSTFKITIKVVPESI